MNPSLVMPLTMKPTSSMWPAIMMRGSSAFPFCRQMTLPSPSWVTDPRPRRCFFMIPAISASWPGGPNASVSSFRSVWLASISLLLVSIGQGRSAGRVSFPGRGVSTGDGSGGPARNTPDSMVGTRSGGNLVLLDHADRPVDFQDGRAHFLHGLHAVLPE